MEIGYDYYLYGLAAVVYITTCWSFSAIRWFHTCRAPKERRAYIWPDRKMQVLIYLFSIILLPYVINPTSQSAWVLYKSYFPASYYFYCGLLLLCFFGSVKQWNRWRTLSWIAAITVVVTLLPPILNAWLPEGMLTIKGISLWQHVVTVESISMMGFCAIAMWQVRHWIKEACDANYSNPEDFPINYARRVWLFPIAFTPILWPAYLLDSPKLMAIQVVLHAVGNIILLLTVLPAWRRTTILMSKVNEDEEDNQQQTLQEEQTEERTYLIAREIENFVVGQKAFLNSHLKMDDVVEHCSFSRTYVSQTFQERLGNFSNYVNRLRLAHYEQYVAEHPEQTKETAAQASGFSSYSVYYRVKRKLEG